MIKMRIFLSVLSLLLVITTSAKASLLDRGNGLVYDSTLNITWLQDANYSGITMEWDTAVNWADNLVFQGYDDWRLPVTDTSCPSKDCTGSEMGHLFYIDGITDNTMGLFSDVKPSMYWSSTEYDDISQAWRFNFKYGTQGTSDKDQTRYAWAVRDGDSSLAVVPEPASSLLFIAGCTALAVRKRFCKKIINI